MNKVDGAIEPDLSLQGEEAAGREELITNAIELDGVVVSDFAFDLDAENAMELIRRGSGTPGGSGIEWGQSEALDIARDEGVVKEASGALAIGDAMVDEFID